MIRFAGKLRRRVGNLLAAPGEELGSWARLAQYQFHLWRFCLRRLREHNAMAMSAALSFRTIFALVPTLVLAFLALRAAGVMGDARQSLRDLMERGGLAQIALVREEPATQPATAPQESAASEGPLATQPVQGASVADRLEEVISGVERQLTLGKLGAVGVVLLVWTAVTLLTTIERSLNRIFQAPRARSLPRRVLLYWSVITFVPLAAASTSYVGQRALALAGTVPGVAWLIGSVGWIGPILVNILLLAAVYTFLPNTKVTFRAALAAAVVAVPLWHAAKWAFALYVTLVARNSLYGALGLIPLFLFWLNLSWMIFLFGAELSHTAANLKRLRSAEEADKILLSPWDVLAAAVAAARPFAAGQGPATRERIVEAMNLPDEPVHRLLTRLCRANVLCEADTPRGEAYAPARPLDQLRVVEILDCARTDDEGAPAGRYADELAGAIDAVRRSADRAIETLTLADLAAKQTEPPAR